MMRAGLSSLLPGWLVWCSMSIARRWRRVLLVGLVGLLGLVGLFGLISINGYRDAVVHEVWVVDDELALDVILDTCNAEVSVDVDEYDDRVVIRGTHHDWYRYLVGSDDCQDVVRVELERPLGDRRVMNSSGGDEIAVIRP